jgi:hypothetical protein
MLAETRVGALAVVQNVSDRDFVNRRLRQIDPALFVELQLTFDDEEVWTVVEDTGERYGAERFVPVYEHRAPDGRPIRHLTDAIVDEMQRRARDGSGNILGARRIANARNLARKEKARAVAEEQTREIAADFQRHRAIGNFASVPRSPALARSRARARSSKVEERLAIDEALRIARALERRSASAGLRAS